MRHSRLALPIASVMALTLVFAQQSYLQSIEAWQEHRNAGLRSPDGWLTLVGLFWLKPGAHTIGSDPSNEFVLPKDAPAHWGRIVLQGKNVSFIPAGKSPVKLSYDENNPTVIHSGSVSFFAIERDGKIGIRAKDGNSPELKNFTGMRFFPVNPKLHFASAVFVPDPKKISILDIIGQTSLEDSPGYVEFEYAGKHLRLRPIYEEQTLFFLFKDLTNKTDTYQAGRMLNTPLPKNGRVDLDFNRAYTPPCTFTPYATCPLPPKENILPVAIDAGEKRYNKGHE